jgi:hypothetical protein
MFAMDYIINALLPYIPTSGFDFPFTIIDQLPTVAPRDFNADFTSDFGKSSNYRAPWKNYGGKLEMDIALRKGNPDAAGEQLAAQVSSIAKQWAAHMIEGTGGVNLLGMNAFLTSFWSGQIIDAGSSASGNVLTLAMLDDLLSKVDNPSAIFCTDIVGRRITTLARTSTEHNINYVVDQFGQQVPAYGGVPIYRMKDGETGTDILSTTEIDGASSQSNTSSVYAIRFGEDGFHGFFPATGSAIDVREAYSGTNAEIWHLDKNAGVVLKHRRAAARVRYVKQAVA